MKARWGKEVVKQELKPLKKVIRKTRWAKKKANNSRKQIVESFEKISCHGKALFMRSPSSIINFPHLNIVTLVGNSALALTRFIAWLLQRVPKGVVSQEMIRRPFGHKILGPRHFLPGANYLLGDICRLNE